MGLEDSPAAEILTTQRSSFPAHPSCRRDAIPPGPGGIRTMLPLGGDFRWVGEELVTLWIKSCCLAPMQVRESEVHSHFKPWDIDRPAAGVRYKVSKYSFTAQFRKSATRSNAALFEEFGLYFSFIFMHQSDSVKMCRLRWQFLSYCRLYFVCACLHKVVVHCFESSLFLLAWETRCHGFPQIVFLSSELFSVFWRIFSKRWYSINRNTPTFEMWKFVFRKTFLFESSPSAWFT